MTSPSKKSMTAPFGHTDLIAEVGRFLSVERPLDFQPRFSVIQASEHTRGGSLRHDAHAPCESRILSNSLNSPRSNALNTNDGFNSLFIAATARGVRA
jgi:hypothetical protein